VRCRWRTRRRALPWNARPARVRLLALACRGESGSFVGTLFGVGSVFLALELSLVAATVSRAPSARTRSATPPVDPATAYKVM
jgi:hypothetical protein